MARRLSWSDVRGGLLACLGIVVAAVAILKFSRVGALHGDTFPLYALVGDARGLMKGSEVWLSGRKIGKITDISFRSPQSADTARRVEIEMELLSRYRDALRRDARVDIRAGGSFVGPIVVYLSPGTTRAAPLQPGDTVLERVQPRFEEASSQLRVAAKEFPAIMANVKVLRAELQTTTGTLGALMSGPAMDAGEMQRARTLVGQLRDKLSSAGTVGAFMNGGLSTRAQQVMARVDSVRTLLSSSETSLSLGRFRRDSTLVAEVDDLRNELTLVRAQLDSQDGTAGRLVHDSAMTNALAAAQQQMTLLFADLKKHPFRYISF